MTSGSTISQNIWGGSVKLRAAIPNRFSGKRLFCKYRRARGLPGRTEEWPRL